VGLEHKNTRKEVGLMTPKKVQISWTTDSMIKKEMKMERRGHTRTKRTRTISVICTH